MAFDDVTCWVVQGGPRARHVDAFTGGGMASTGWDFDDLGDLSATPDAEVFLQLEARGRRKPADDLRDLRIFTDRIAVGDVVVVHDTAAGDLLFGEVTGPYAYAPLGGLHRHTREVRWFGRLAMDLVEPFLAAAIAVRQPVKRLPEQLHWQRLAGEVDDFLGRPVDDVRRPTKVSTVRRGGTTAAAPRLRPAPKPVVTGIPDRLCPSCGLLRAPTLFDDGEDVCRDCA